ncbi:MAG: ABC-F family ATP-binding cassette domain-containing protein [Paludibacteraceae bacterium]|nr:ABC-F family ATP-binding cassette domain-containing protein [Paludibacteraceae bacterium]
MISVENLTVEFSAKALFDKVCYVINKRDRIALVGKNGAGKSTMLKIIAGLQEPTSGRVAIPKDVTIGYLPQHMIHNDDTTVRDEAAKAFNRILQLQTRLEELNTQLCERTDYESDAYMALIDEIAHLNEQLEMQGGGNFDAEVEKTLMGLGFVRSDFTRPTNEFSGGWRMRIELAKILLQRPDVLLLDEPTNHLDIESIQWLEQFMAGYPGAVVLVSHDRKFLDTVTKRTIEISLGKIYDYKASYTTYVELRKERREQQMRAYQNQQKEIADTEAFIERFRYQATKAIQVQSRIKQLAKIERIEIDEEDTSALRLKFPPAPHSGSYPIIMEGVSKSYGNHVVFSGVDLTLNRGDKVAFVGKNGEGKSTLVKCIMNEITDFTGKLQLGHQVKIGYFAQNQASLLDETRTVFETIDYVAVGDIRTKIRDILGAFMFGGEASDKKVGVLSGGERSRLAMIRLLLEPVNLLILDEPTNHLDMRSKDVLKQAIKEFDGTVIVVSHDREFLDGLVDKVYEFGGGRVREHLGGIYDFLSNKKMESLKELESQKSKVEGQKSNRSLSLSNLCARRAQSQTCLNYAEPQPKIFKGPISEQESLSGAFSLSVNNTSTSSATAKELSYEERKEQQRKIKRAERLVELCEVAIAETEKAIADVEATLASGDTSQALFDKYAALKAQLEKEMTEWEEATEAYENLKEK